MKSSDHGKALSLAVGEVRSSYIVLDLLQAVKQRTLNILVTSHLLSAW